MSLAQYIDLPLKNVTWVYEKIDIIKWKSKKDKLIVDQNHCLLLVLQGKARCCINGKSYVYGKNTILWIRKGDDYFAESLETPFHYIAVTFTLHSDFDNMGLEAANWTYFFRDFNENTMERLFRKMLDSFLYKEPCYRLEMKMVLLNIVRLLFTSKEHQICFQNSPLSIRPAITYIHDNYLAQTIEIQELSKMCNLSVRQFSRIFTKAHQITPKKYINRLKIEYAKRLLKSTVLSVAEIAKQACFSDTFYFCKTFKFFVGISPSQYRKNAKRPLGGGVD